MFIILSIIVLLVYDKYILILSLFVFGLFYWSAAGGFKDWANNQINSAEVDRIVAHDEAETQRVKEHNTSNQDNPRPYPKPVNEKAIRSRDHFKLSDKNRELLEKVVGLDSEDDKKKKKSIIFMR